MFLFFIKLTHLFKIPLFFFFFNWGRQKKYVGYYLVHAYLNLTGWKGISNQNNIFSVCSEIIELAKTFVLSLSLNNTKERQNKGCVYNFDLGFCNINGSCSLVKCLIDNQAFP